MSYPSKLIEMGPRTTMADCEWDNEQETLRLRRIYHASAERSGLKPAGKAVEKPKSLNT